MQGDSDILGSAMSTNQFFLPFIRKEKVGEDTYSFYFDRSVRPFDYLPGQYVDMILPHTNPDNRGISRDFTISNPPQDDELMITTRIIRSSFKKALANLNPGVLVQFLGPKGAFILPSHKELVFLAGGIGITPFYSMITYVALKNLTQKITLFASFSTVEQMVFRDTLEKISAKSKTIHIIYTLTKPEESKQLWTGESGRISSDLIRKYIKDLSAPLYLIVGPSAMVESTDGLLRDMGIAREQIRVEDFTGY